MKKLIALVCLSLLASCAVVDTGSVGIKKRFGEIKGEVLGEGLHFYNPITINVVNYSVREDSWSDTSSIFTRDTQRTEIAFTAVYRPDADAVIELYRSFGNREAFESKVIRPVVLASIKDVIGQIIADDLISKREIATKTALEEVRANLSKRHVTVTDLQFTNIDFDDSYENAVEQKVVAVQNAQKAKNDTVRIEEEAKQKIKTAEAEAESMRIKSEALSKNKGLIDFEMVQKWDGKLPQYMFGNTVPLLNLDRLKQSADNEEATAE